MHNQRSLPMTAFLVSLLSLFFEVVLTRMFSLLLGPQMSYLALSLAVLGGGLGAAWIYRKVEKDEQIMSTVWRGWMSSYLLCALVLVIPWPWMISLPIYLVAATVPFFWAGAVMSLLFALHTEKTHSLYLADLTGAALGSALSLVVVTWVGALNAVMLVAALAAVITVLLVKSTRTLIRNAALVMVGALFLTVIGPGLLTRLYLPKPLFEVLKTDKQSRIVWSRWDAIGRTDVVSQMNDEKRAIFIDGSAGTVMVGHPERPEIQAAIEQDIAYLPFAWLRPETTLALGSGGGKDVLMALKAGSSKVTAVEINAAAVEAVKAMSDYNGGVYTDPRVQVVVADGRDYVRRTTDKYDLIYLSLVMTGTSERNGLALTESHIYTKEAFSDYLSHLKEDGRVALVLHDEYDLTKAITTALAALQERMSLPDAIRSLAIVAEKEKHGHEGMGRPVLLMAAQPWTADETVRFVVQSQVQGNNVIHAPWVREDGPFQGMLNGTGTLTDFTSQFPFDTRPATDDRPFFYNNSNGIPSFVTAVIFATLGLLLSLIQFGSVGKTKGDSQTTLAFGGLGLAFMLVESALIGRFVLVLGKPLLVLPLVLTAMLLAAGIGSALAKVLRIGQKGLLLVTTGIALYLLAIPSIVDMLTAAALGWSVPVRVTAVVTTVIPLGILMGMPFPTAMAGVGSSNPDLIPILWAANGIASVLGSAINIALSITMGGTTALWVGAVAYLGTGLLINRQWAQPQHSTAPRFGQAGGVR